MTIFVAGLIRTVVPALVGALSAWLVSLGLELPVEAYEGLIAGMGLLFTGVYYAVVRLIEDRVPQFGWLLGLAKSPDSYSKGPGVQLTQKPPVDCTEGICWEFLGIFRSKVLQMRH